MTAIETRAYRGLTIELHVDQFPHEPDWDDPSEDAMQAWRDGDVYGFVIRDASNDHLDSCWGFYGEADYCMEEGQRAADYIADERDQHAQLIAATELLAY